MSRGTLTLTGYTPGTEVTRRLPQSFSAPHVYKAEREAKDEADRITVFEKEQDRPTNALYSVACANLSNFLLQDSEASFSKETLVYNSKNGRYYTVSDAMPTGSVYMTAGEPYGTKWFDWLKSSTTQISPSLCQYTLAAILTENNDPRIDNMYLNADGTVGGFDADCSMMNSRLRGQLEYALLEQDHGRFCTSPKKELLNLPWPNIYVSRFYHTTRSSRSNSPVAGGHAGRAWNGLYQVVTSDVIAANKKLRAMRTKSEHRIATFAFIVENTQRLDAEYQKSINSGIDLEAVNDQDRAPFMQELAVIYQRFIINLDRMSQDALALAPFQAYLRDLPFEQQTAFKKAFERRAKQAALYTINHTLSQYLILHCDAADTEPSVYSYMRHERIIYDIRQIQYKLYELTLNPTDANLIHHIQADVKAFKIKHKKDHGTLCDALKVPALPATIEAAPLADLAEDAKRRIATKTTKDDTLVSLARAVNVRRTTHPLRFLNSKGFRGLVSLLQHLRDHPSIIIKYRYVILDTLNALIQESIRCCEQPSLASGLANRLSSSLITATSPEHQFLLNDKHYDNTDNTAAAMRDRVRTAVQAMCTQLTHPEFKEPTAAKLLDVSLLVKPSTPDAANKAPSPPRIGLCAIL
jgi:hypothetical protein